MANEKTITRAQIIDLRREAKVAGDYEQADMCGLALAGDEDAVRRCAAVIQAAKAMDDESVGS